MAVYPSYTSNHNKNLYQHYSTFFLLPAATNFHDNPFTLAWLPLEIPPLEEFLRRRSASRATAVAMRR